MDPLRISLAAARVNAGLTQDQVATQLGVTKRTVIDWEKGRTEPTVSRAYQLAALFGLHLDSIIF